MTLLTRLFVLLFCFVSLPVLAKSDVAYLPDNVTYDDTIPTPEEVLGSPVGEWHVRHDQLVQYMRVLAERSERISLIEMGRTYENRPLILLAITAEEKQSQLEQIRRQHLANLQRGNVPDEDAPLVLWMGYSVHGDEASGSNAALLVAYYLAAAQGEEVTRLLENSVVLLDPSLNPDGLSRFAQWVNMHKGKNLVSDPAHREHVQAWPSGRTNHYWFDLNRDWLLLVHPESRARIEHYQRWRPHVLTDFHEMGVDSTYFFQPGIASRKNPWTPEQNVRLTEALGDYHAAALDAQKQLYFTQESFDDFYYGKGSTYPDAQGTVGILFEQASSRGHLQDSIHGPRSFADAVQNQVTTSLSTFAGALANKQALLRYQAGFDKQTAELVKDDNLRGYLVREPVDKVRLQKLVDVLRQHQIEVKGLNKKVTVDDTVYASHNSIFVPLDQPQYRLIKSIFSTRKRFNDNTFYDVSNWNLPLAYNLDFAPVAKKVWGKMRLTDELPALNNTQGNTIVEDAYAYAFSWRNYAAPALLQDLLAADVQARIAGQPFTANSSQGKVNLHSGSVIIPTALKQPENLSQLVNRLSTEHGIKVWSLTSGLTSEGIDLGSRRMRPVDVAKVLIVGGPLVSQYEVGEAWHYLDQRVGMPVSIVELERLNSLNLTDYSHMIWVDGNYTKVRDNLLDKVGAWVESGGVLIGQKAASELFSEQGWLKASFVSEDDIDAAFDTEGLGYADREALSARKRIAGAVFETRLDLGHPLAFGYTDATLPVFRNSTRVMQVPDEPFFMAAQYSRYPLMAGYTADELQKLLGESAAVVAHEKGDGKVIGFTDNPNFRGYWLGTSRLLSNAIFMAPFITVGD